MTSCPAGRYTDSDRAGCLPCHYTCADCTGPNDYQCSACHGDATLRLQPAGAACLNTELLQQAETAYRRYSGALLAALVLAAALLLLALLYWRQRRARSSGYRALPVGFTAGPGYTDAPPASGGGKRPVTVVRPPPGTLPHTEIELLSDASSEEDREDGVLLTTK